MRSAHGLFGGKSIVGFALHTNFYTSFK